MKKVSIIVPIYNEEENLKRCVDSLINQTYLNLEIILLNDGSTDKSKEIIDSYKDKRVMAIHKKNTGIGDTRNLGIKESTGDYIMFVDSDDYLELNAIEILINTITKDKSDLVMFNYYLDTPNKTFNIKLPTKGVTSIQDDKELLTKIQLGPCTKLYKSDLINDLKFPRNIKYEDVPFVVSATVKAKKISIINDYLYHYVIKKTGETITKDERIMDILKICSMVENTLNEKGLPLTNFMVKTLSYYLKNSRYIPDKKIRNKLINSVFTYLNKIDKKWRNCSYLKKESFIKRVIITHKPLLNLVNLIKK